MDRGSLGAEDDNDEDILLHSWLLLNRDTREEW